MLETLKAPFGQVRFREVVFADIITSIGSTLQDIGFAIYYCEYDNLTMDGSLAKKNKYVSAFYLICGFLPFWLRFW